MITTWLSNFETYWKEKDIERILSLFDDSVMYWENPHLLLEDKKEIQHMWEAIHSQHNIELSTELYSSEGEKHTIDWKLSYEDETGAMHMWAGVYLITLNDQGKCDTFYQVGEEK